MSAFEHLLTGWDGQQVAVRYDAEFATWMFIGVHSTSSGRSGGGTRMAVYAAPEDGLADALKLSAAMTRKMAVCNVAMGGGKAVLAVPELPTGDARVELLHRYGDFIGSLGGLYATAPDMNTSERDMDTIGERTEHVFCKSVENGGSGSTAPDTAVGVFHGIRASVRFALDRDLDGVRVLVQGLGAVGARLAQQLSAAGAEVLVSDIDAERVAASGLQAIDPADVIGTECDVYAPCAMGGTITATTVEALRCRVVAGAANNQLAVAGARRPAARARDPLRARLRHQLRRRPARHRPRAARLGPAAARRGPARPRRHAARALRRQRPLPGPRRRGARGR